MERVRSIFEEIALNHGFEINTMGLADDRVDIFLPFPPRYSISKAVGIMKNVSAGVIFHEHPEVKKHLLPTFLILFSISLVHLTNAVFSKCQEKYPHDFDVTVFLIFYLTWWARSVK
ncbi:MAG: transposase [Syntrophales bacterium]|nr:transposase [Syntrophales bacterium]